MDEMTGAIALDPEGRAAEFHLGNGRALRVHVRHPDSYGNCQVVLTAVNAGFDVQITPGREGHILLAIVQAWQH